MKISPLFFYLDEKILSVQSKNLFATAKALYTALAVLRAGSNALHQGFSRFTKTKNFQGSSPSVGTPLS